MASKILFIGEARTNYKLNEITKQTSVSFVEQTYGGDLSDAFKTAIEIIDEECDIYLANVKTNYEYIDLIYLASNYNFEYIVPINIRLSDMVRNIDTNERRYLVDLLLDIIINTCSSTLVVTDNHANLYENIDHFLNDMLDKVNSFKECSESIINGGTQLWFVANNLKDTPYANVLLACVMIVAKLPNYPDYNFPKAIFDLDDLDLDGEEIIYFKNHTYRNTTIENFVNFNSTKDVYKIVPINTVVRKIGEGLDLSSFEGKIYNKLIPLRVQTLTAKYLQSLVGKMIRAYEINSVQIKLEKNFTYTIIITMTITPINSLEQCELIIKR